MADIQYYIDNDTICSVCYAEFLDIDDLKVHTIQYHLTNTNKNRFCKFCSIIFASIDDFALHMRNDHLSDLKSCKYCSKMYINVNSLLEHEKRHKNEAHFLKLSCSQCETSFDNKSDLENHEYGNHKDTDDGIMLQHCFASLSALINMNIRRFLEVYHRDCLYVCAICDMSTPECSLYIQHLKKGKCHSYACNECFNVYTMKRSLREHCGRHLRIKSYKCPNYKKQCLKCSNYYTKYDLQRHLKDCNIIKCRQCPLRFDSVSGLANHITIHSQKIPAQFISCKYCRKPVIGMNALEKHIERTHKHNLHLYKYSCIHCDISFKHPKLLFGHFYTKHKDIQPYTCKICNKKFRLRKKFTLHIKLDHKSVGFVEFDENFHVYFTDKKLINTENTLKIKENFVNSLDLIKKSTLEEQDKEQTNILDKAENEQKLLKNNEISSEVNTDILETYRNENIKNIITNGDTEECGNSSSHHGDIFDLCLSEVNKKKTLEDITKREAKRGSSEELIFENIEILEPELIESDSDSSLLMVRKKRKYTKNKNKTFTNEPKLNLDDSSDDSDIPLVKFVKEKSKKIKEKRGRPKAPWNKCPARVPKSKKFMCLKCNTNCYTYQNYNRHMNMHKKNKNKSCIKCVRQFKTTEDLVHHIKSEHATSKLTETLKKMLDQRRKDEHEIYISEKFVQTMHKVPVAKNISQATITRVNNRLSVKKFWENFTPDNDGKKDGKISIRQVSDRRAEPLIKLTKFNPELPTQGPSKLKMPTKYTDSVTEQYNVSIKLVHCDLAPSALNFHNEITITDINYNEIENQSNKDIPEIAHEIMLEETEVKNVKYIKKTVILKDLLRYNNVKIGHLAPQAPYFKIVSIDDVLQEDKAKEPIKPDKVVLPDGTKLVNVNPLAHLLNNKNIKEICKSSLKSKSTARVQNFSEAIVKAMTLLDKPIKKNVKRVESSDPIEIE